MYIIMCSLATNQLHLMKHETLTILYKEHCGNTNDTKYLKKTWYKRLTSHVTSVDCMGGQVWVEGRYVLSFLCGWAGVGYKSEGWDVGQVFTRVDVG